LSYDFNEGNAVKYPQQNPYCLWESISFFREKLLKFGYLCFKNFGEMSL